LQEPQTNKTNKLTEGSAEETEMRKYFMYGKVWDANADQDDLRDGFDIVDEICRRCSDGFDKEGYPYLLAKNWEAAKQLFAERMQMVWTDPDNWSEAPEVVITQRAEDTIRVEYDQNDNHLFYEFKISRS
jgi:hypothetical protein